MEPMVEDTHFTAAGAADQSLYGRADELQVVSDLVGGLAEGGGRAAGARAVRAARCCLAAGLRAGFLR